MKYSRLKLYYVKNEYIDYLRKYDEIVPYNKNATRPYIGIVYTYNEHNYFAPLTSPKLKHMKMNNHAIDIWKIDSGKLGIVNFNNMIPCPNEVLEEVLPTIKDKKYKNLLENQLSSLNKNREMLIRKIERFHKKYRNNQLENIVKNRCCNFPLLEEKSKEYTNISNQRSKLISKYDDFDIEK